MWRNERDPPVSDFQSSSQGPARSARSSAHQLAPPRPIKPSRCPSNSTHRQALRLGLAACRKGSLTTRHTSGRCRSSTVRTRPASMAVGSRGPGPCGRRPADRCPVPACRSAFAAVPGARGPIEFAQVVHLINRRRGAIGGDRSGLPPALASRCPCIVLPNDAVPLAGIQSRTVRASGRVEAEHVG